MNKEWKEVQHQLWYQAEACDPLPSDVMMSLSSFLSKFPNAQHSVTTICFPPIHRWCAKGLENLKGAVWISVPDDEIDPEAYRHG